MIIELAISNFRSIRDRQIMTLQADGNVGKKTLSDNLIKPLEKSHGGLLLNTLIIYGANASGKSNFLRGLHSLEYLVTNSKDFKLDRPISVYEPFKLDKTSRHAPTLLEIEFVANDQIRYRYEVQFDRFKIVKETLFCYPKDRHTVRKALLFSRNEQCILEFGDHYRGKRDFSINPNQLILSQAGVVHPSIVEAYRFFSTYLFYASAQSSLFDEALLKVAEKYLLMEDTVFKKAIISLIEAADTGISDIFIQKLGDEKLRLPDDMPENEKQKILNQYRNRIKTIHPIYDKGELISEEVFDLNEESTGTIKLLGLAGIIVEALQNGATIIVDELDKNLHPLLSRMLIQLFQNPKMNPHHAQLIFSTHDISLIDIDLFRRDQIYLIDKNTEGSSLVFRLSDFTGISKVIPLQKWYMNGLFKGVPAINSAQINLNYA